MEYTLAAGVALEVGLALALVTGATSRRSFWVGLVAFAALTVAADSALVGVGVFSFGERSLTGVRLGLAPVEDVLYGAALYSVAVSAYRWRLAPDLGRLLRASRPYSWINTALPALAAGALAGRPSAGLVLGVAYFLLPYNLLLYGVNDVFDYESDRRNPRKRGGVEGGVVVPAERRRIWAAVAVTNLPLLALIVVLAGPLAGAALGLTAMVAVVYSAPPLRTKEIPGLDSLTSALHFVLPAVCGGLLAGAGLEQLPWRYLFAFLLWGTASHALGAIQDLAADREAGIGSVAVSLGARATAAASLLLYVGAVAVTASGGGIAVAAAAALLPYALLAGSVLFGDSARQARRAWRGFLGMNLLSGFLVTQVLLRAAGVGRLTVAELLAWGSALGALALVAVFVDNQRRMRRPAAVGAPPAASVVIPARDEAGRIEACLASLPPDADVIVVDDGSRDGTAAVAAARGARVVTAGARPPGWTGKCWACWRGAQMAAGQVLIFVDSDTVLAPGAAAEMAALATDGLTSFVSRYEMLSRAERVLMPAFAILQLAVWPHRLLPLANGPLMAVRRSEYLELGGHSAISTSVREDLDLARLYTSAGRRVRLLRGADLAATRHYATAGQAMAAWRRMFYAYASSSLAVALAGMAGLGFVLLGPPLLLVAALATGDAPALAGALAGCGLLLGLRLALAARERQPLSTVLWHPLTVLATLAAMAASVVDGLAGRDPVWRGVPMTGEAR